MGLLRTMVKQMAVATLLVVGQRIAARVIGKVAAKRHRPHHAKN